MEKNQFNPQIGHSSLQSHILNSIKNDHLPHAFLFYGNEGAGKEAFAIEVAKLLNCDKGPLHICQRCSHCIKIAGLEHPDVKFIFPIPAASTVKLEDIGEAIRDKAQNPFRRTKFSGKNTFISIDAIRDLKREARFKLYEGKKKIFIITEADQMRPEAANALLKMLEEPPQNLMLILITSRIHRILPTIRSRCQLVHFPPLDGDLIIKTIRKYTPDPPEHLARIVKLSLENIKLAFEFIEEDVLRKREQAVEFLRKVVLIDKSQELLNLIEEITRPRERRNMILLLSFLLSWFRDTLYYKTDPSGADRLINSDLKENLEGFVNGYPAANYPRIISQVEKAIRDLEDPRNLNPTLIFTSLAIKLNRLIKQG